MVESKVYPQNLNIAFSSAGIQPAVVGMPWYDTTNAVLRICVDTSSTNAVACLPQHTITGGHGPKVTITQSNADNALSIVKSNLSTGAAISVTNLGTSPAVLVAQSGTADAVRVDQSGNGLALSIFKYNTGSAGAIYVQGAGTGASLQLNQTNDGLGLYITQTGNNHGILVVKSNTSTSYNAVAIVNQAGGHALYIGNSSTAGSALYIGNSSTAGSGIHIQQDRNANGLTVVKSDTGNATAVAVYSSASAGAIWMTQSGTNSSVALGISQSATGDANAVQISVGSSARHGIVLLHSGSNTAQWIGVNAPVDGVTVHKTNVGIGTCLQIINSGTGYGAFINQVGDQAALGITKAGGVISAAGITNFGTGAGLGIAQNGNGVGLHINKTSAGTGNCIQIDNGGTGWALSVTQSGAGSACYINKSYAGSGSALHIDNSGTGLDIEGNGGNWWVDKAGNASFATVATATSRVVQMSQGVTGWSGSTASWNVLVPAGNWYVKVEATHHQYISVAVTLKINGLVVTTLPGFGNTEGTDWVPIFGFNTVTGPINVPIVITSGALWSNVYWVVTLLPY